MPVPAAGRPHHDQCARWQDLVGDFVDGSLAQHEHHDMRRHLRGCPACRREVDLEHEVRRGVAQAPVPGAPLALTDQLVQIGGDQYVWMSRSGATALPSRRERRRRAAAASMGSMLLTLAMVALVGWVMAPGVPSVHGMGDELARSYRTQAAARAAATPSCPEGFECPAELAGLPLVGVSVVAGDLGPRVHLRYASGQLQVVVVQQHGRLDGGDAAMASVVDGWTVRTWQSDTLVLAVGSTTGPLLATACADLPHRPPAATDGLHRIVLGWEHLGGR